VGENFIAINPDECIDCAVCIAECPVNAIYADEDVPADQQEFIALNAELVNSPGFSRITKSKPSLPGADKWKDVPKKAHLLKRETKGRN
jgi:ferredoxin